MDTRTVTRGNTIVTVRNAYRRTPILAAQYMAALRAAYPELAEYEEQQAAIDLPRLTTTDETKMTDEDRVKWADYLGKMTRLKSRNQLGAEYWLIAELIVPLLARTSGIVNGPFAIGANGRMETGEVVKAFEAYQDLETPNDCLWSDMVKAINELDRPLTPVYQQPKEALTAEQMADPLSVADTPVGTERLAATY